MEKSPHLERPPSRSGSKRGKRPGKGFRLWVGGPVPRQADAITLGRVIIVRKSAATSSGFEQLLRHELTHIDQWKRLGYRRFATRYVGEYMSARRRGLSHHDAYLAISFEVEARRHSRQRFVATVIGMDQPAVTLETVSEAHRRLQAFVDALTDVELRSPSSLDGWTVGHVIAHLAMNARAFTTVAKAALTGTPAYMYESVEARNSEIERYAPSSPAEIAMLINSELSEMEQAWAVLLHADHSHEMLVTFAATASGLPEFELNTVLMRRLREVEVHSIDCGLRQRTVDGWSSVFVDNDVVTQFATVERRTEQPVHIIDEQGAHFATPGAEQLPATHVTRRQLLGWLLDRSHPATLTALPPLPTLAPWGNQSNWSPAR